MGTQKKPQRSVSCTLILCGLQVFLFCICLRRGFYFFRLGPRDGPSRPMPDMKNTNVGSIVFLFYDCEQNAVGD